MAGVGIVIVTYNSEAEIGACLDATVATGAEVVVVDNASSDATLTEVRRRGVSLVANKVNRGFAAAVNQGVRTIGADFVLLLNPDAVLQTGVEALREACENPGAGAAGGKLVDTFSEVDASRICRPKPPHRDGLGLRSLTNQPALARQPSELALPLLRV